MEIPVLSDDVVQKLRKAEYHPAVRTEPPKKTTTRSDPSNDNPHSERLFKLPEQPSKDKMERKNSKRNLNSSEGIPNNTINTNVTPNNNVPNRYNPGHIIGSNVQTPKHKTPIQTPIQTPVHTPVQTPLTTPVQTPTQTPNRNVPKEGNSNIGSTPQTRATETPQKTTKTVTQQEEISPERAKLRKIVELAKQRRREKKALEEEQRALKQKMDALKKDVGEWMEETGVGQASCHSIGFNQREKYRSEPTTISDVLLIVKDLYDEDTMNRVIKEVDILHTRKNANNFDIKFTVLEDQEEKPKTNNKRTKTTKETSPKATISLKKRKVVLG